MKSSGSAAGAVLPQAALTLFAVLLFTRFGGLFSLPPADVSAFWPANAILFAGAFAMQRLHARLTLLLALPTYLVAELWIGYPLASAAIYSLANVTEVVVLIWLLRASMVGELTFDRLRTLFVFLALALLASVCGGVIGSLPTVLEGGDFATVLLRWSLADFFGYCLFAPLLLSLGELRRFFSAARPGRIAEAAGLVAALLVAQALSFGVLGQAVSSGAQFLPMPILLWAALRFGAPGGAIATVIVACVAFFSAAHGVGAFAIGSPEENLTSLQLFFASLVVSVMTIACLNTERRRSLDALQIEVAERRKAEEALRQSEMRYRSIFENSPVSIWEEDFSRVKALFDELRQAGVTDIEAHFDRHPEVIRQCAELARIIEVNRATLDLHEAKSRTELMAGLVGTFTAESFDTFRYELVCLWHGRTELVRDAVVKTLAGEPRPVTVYFAVCPGYETTLAKVFVSLVDITERKAAEMQLKQVAEFTEGVINAIPDILFEVDAQGHYLNVWTRNPELLAAPKEVLIGRTLSDILSPEAAAIAMDGIREAEAKGLSFGKIIRIDFPQGARWFELSLSKELREEAAAEARFLVLSRDVTERIHMEEALRASEQRFRAIFDQSVQLIGLLSTDGQLLEANRAALELAGVGEPDVLGKPFWEAPWWSHSTELQQRLREGIAEAARGNLVRFEATHRAADGTLRDIDFSLKPVTDSAGRVVQLIPEGRDITDRKLAERERQAHIDHLAALDRINHAIQISSDLEAMLGNVLDQVLDIFACDRAFLMYPCDPAAKSWTIPMERTRPEYPGAGVMRAEIPMDLEVAATVRLLLNTQSAVKFGPGTDRPLPVEISARYGFKSFISMALYPRVGKAWQFGLHQCSHGRIWTKVEEELLLDIGRKLTDGLTSLLIQRDLHDSERRLIEAQRLAHLGNWELDLIDDALIWSDEIFRIFEIDKEEFGASYDAFLGAIHPEDRERVNQAYRDSLENKQPYDIVHRLLMKDGRIKFVREMCETVYDSAGKPVRSLGTIQDITEQKLKEEELARYRDHLEEVVRQRTTELSQQQAFSHAVLENINDGIVACDGQGRLSYFNRATRLIHGIEQENLPPERWSEHYRLLEEDGVTPMPTERIPLLRAYNGEQIREQSLIIAHADGSLHFMLCSGQAMFNEAGEKLGAVVSLHDITVQKRAEAEIILARDAAEAANRAKSLFLANMSHELRTPLNAILGFSSLLHRDPDLNEAQRETVDIINRSGEHLLTLINDVLEIAKIESGRLRLDVAPFDLGELVRDVSEMMRLRAEQKGLTLELDQSSEFPRYIKADEARLRQILVNLVGNAVKFTSQGGVVIRLGVKENHRSHLVIEVEDSGPGIQPEDRQRLFQPFQQLADGAKHGGTGLGLTIARQFAQMMGGDIGLDSEPDRGSCFRVDLPLQLASADEARRVGERPLQDEVAGLAPGQPAWRILIAEDQYENRILLEHLMANLGLQTKSAENGEACVSIFEEWRPDLIWMDRRMPVMDGVEATRRIRALPGGDQVKIVAVTASVFKEQQPELAQAGMDDLVRKPYRASEIYDCMARQLGVEFVYRVETGEASASCIALRPERLAALPAALRGELREALEHLDGERIEASVRRVKSFDLELATTLSKLVEYFDYPAVLAALDAGDVPET